MHELTVGQKVICKHKNGRYYQCDVVQLSKETFYEVNFDDGSFSDNLFPEDIVVGLTSSSVFCHSKENKTNHSKKQNVEFSFKVLLHTLHCHPLRYLCATMRLFSIQQRHHFLYCPDFHTCGVLYYPQWQKEAGLYYRRIEFCLFPI